MEIVTLRSVAGVNVLIDPYRYIEFCRAGMLSPSGLCSTFDEDADGYVRAEGCGALVLKALDNTEEHSTKHLAVLKSTAVNQDGRSAGLTAPNGLSQEIMLRRALSLASLESTQVNMIECHGTGTALGDPIEVGALQSVFGEDRRNQLLLLGAAKTNVGHLEAAAGIVGVIKTVLCLNNGHLPPNLNFNNLNPEISLHGWATLPESEGTDLEGDTLIGGVSSFGFGGTNAHAIIEAVPKRNGMEYDYGEPTDFVKQRYGWEPVKPASKKNTSEIESWLYEEVWEPVDNPVAMNNGRKLFITNLPLSIAEPGDVVLSTLTLESITSSNFELCIIFLNDISDLADRLLQIGKFVKSYEMSNTLIILKKEDATCLSTELSISGFFLALNQELRHNCTVVYADEPTCSDITKLKTMISLCGNIISSDVIQYTQDGLKIRQLRNLSNVHTSNQLPQIDRSKYVIISGGLGGLGLVGCTLLAGTGLSKLNLTNTFG